MDASRGGIPYHCRASSVQFGTIRSRTATVYYACEFSVLFLAQMSTFLLWQSLVDLLSEKLSHTVLRMHPVYLIKTMWLSTAMCQGLTSPPSITWVDDLNQTIPTIGTSFLYLDGGRYLAIIGVDPVTAQRVFHCRVTNVFGMLSMDIPTRYRFNITGESSSFPVHIRRCVPSSPPGSSGNWSGHLQTTTRCLCF